VVADAARTAGFEVCAFIDRKPPAAIVDGLPVYATLKEALAACTDSDGTPRFIVAIGDNKQRAEEYAHACECGLESTAVIHPTAVISDAANIGAGVYVGAQAVINPGAQIGKNAIINTAAIIEHDCLVGVHSFVAPSALLCGQAIVGDYTFVGAGAVLIPQVNVGTGSLVAAGAVVTDSHPGKVRLFGVPARERA
jgi:sugar O-acyltransferase (sialic acid O-acetyltransferase NeuD family)